MRSAWIRNNRGATLIFVMGFGAVMATIAAMVLLSALRSYTGSDNLRGRIQSHYSAESGLAYGIEMVKNTPNVTGDKTISLTQEAFMVKIEREGNDYTITSTGYYPDADDPRRVETIRGTFRKNTTGELVALSRSFD